MKHTRMEENDTKCVFCNIILGNMPKPEDELLFQDEDFVAFRDIKPATSHHYLIVPKKHIKNPAVLKEEDIALVERLVEIGKELLKEQNADMDDTRFGFHWPPFNTVHHLHLHAISQVSQMSFLSRLIFRPNSMWFITAEALLQRLDKAKSVL